ncbi:S41 family peptidase [Pseudalkalibacillus sp. R45]
MQAEKLSSEVQSEIIHLLVKALNDHYVFPDVAREMGEQIEGKTANDGYLNIHDTEDFCAQLTKDLRSISSDKHLSVRYTEQEKSIDQNRSLLEQKEEYLLKAKVDNYGYSRIERLSGNIGYIDLRKFYNPEYAGEAAANAMNLVANTEALIFDLRKNGGGSPEMVAFLTSYLFESDSFHLNSFYMRTNDSMRQFWTLPYVPGKKYGEKPVYVLTGHDTFSAAEEFTYNLKNLKRATIIGETTAGGANPGGFHQLTKHVSIFIPNGRAINPITETNWEGTGVDPDIETVHPFEKAYELALQDVINQYQDKKEYAFLVKEAREALEQIECWVKK